MTWDADRAGESDEKKALRVARTRAAVARLIFFCTAPGKKTHSTQMRTGGLGISRSQMLPLSPKLHSCFLVIVGVVRIRIAVVKCRQSHPTPKPRDGVNRIGPTTTGPTHTHRAL